MDRRPDRKGLEGERQAVHGCRSQGMQQQGDEGRQREGQVEAQEASEVEGRVRGRGRRPQGGE